MVGHGAEADEQILCTHFLTLFKVGQNILQDDLRIPRECRTVGDLDRVLQCENCLAFQKDYSLIGGGVLSFAMLKRCADEEKGIVGCTCLTIAVDTFGISYITLNAKDIMAMPIPIQGGASISDKSGPVFLSQRQEF